MDTPVVQSAREDKDAMIQCMVKGDPEPTVSWYFNGQLLNCKYKNWEENTNFTELGLDNIQVLY